MKPICLWSDSNDCHSEVAEQSAIISGWDALRVFNGSFTVPISLNANLTSAQKCESWGYNESISSSILCLPRLEKNGGVLMIKKNERWLLRGMIALRTNYDEYMSKQYILYSNITKYLTWIQKNMLT